MYVPLVIVEKSTVSLPSVKSGASTVTCRSAVVVAVSPLSPSVLMTERLRVKSLASPAGGVMVKAANAQPEISTLVLPVDAVKLLAPSLKAAPIGMPPITTDSVSELSSSTRLGSMLSAIAVSWSPVASTISSVGASAMAATVTATSAVLTARSLFSASTLVAMIVRVKPASLLAGGVMAREASVQPVMSAVVLPLVAVKLLVPSLKVAPSGMALISSDSSSDPSVSTSAGSIESAMAMSSLPEASATVSAGASATADTETDRSPLIVASSPLLVSVLIAVTARVKSAPLSAGGVMVSADKVQSDTSTLVLPGVAVKLLVPSLSVAPTGIAPIKTVRVSEPSRSDKAVSTSSAIAESSLPEAGSIFSVGASSTATTVI